MIGQVREHVTVLLDAVADRRALVRDVSPRARSPNRSSTSLRLVVEHELRRDVGEPHREQRRRQVDRDALVEALHRRRRTPEVHLGVRAGTAAGRSRGPAGGRGAGASAGCATRVRRSPFIATPSGRMPVPASRTSRWPLSSSHLDAGRVAAVAHGVGPGRRERTTTSPHARAHQRSPLRSSERPEHGDDTVQLLLRAEQRVRGRVDVAAARRRSTVHRTRRCAGRRSKNAMPAGESRRRHRRPVRMAQIEHARRIRAR